MVSFLRYLCTDQQSKQEQVEIQKQDHSRMNPVDINRTVSEGSDDQFSARSTPSAHRITFQSMLMDIKNSKSYELNDWSVKKIFQYTCYLSDRLRKSKAFRGYFLIICRLIDLLKQHLQMMAQDGRELSQEVDKEALVMTLMCVQALNKVYGRRSDVRASCHILVEQVAGDFSAVTKTLKDGLRSIHPSLQIAVADFIVPRDSRMMLAELKREIKLQKRNEDGSKVKEALIRILSAHKIRVSDFTQGDIIWLEREVVHTNDPSKLDSMQLVLMWLLHLVHPRVYPQPVYQF
eukprot:TRINITY_DN3220_c0_g1_i1.p1 TRINITY_DN3220_c0_g1~~TRINITY_DN3220_c0_g1_i1.p1  ORF type:complete len:291 (-),score=13.98 TRINITY_DN3220_c0_g1_i1:150-1022(-)